VNTRPVEELVQWWADEYNKGIGYASVIMHPEGTLFERPSAKYSAGRLVNRDGLVAMENRQLALQPDRQIHLEWVAPLADEGHALIQYWHQGHTKDGSELTFFGVSTIKFVDDKVYRWVDTVVRFKRPEDSAELTPY
jgi:hypothetical protein